MSSSPTQFAWSILGWGDWPPPEKFATHDPLCFLCGGPTGGLGWHPKALPNTFTNHNFAAVQSSHTICMPCMALGSKEAWLEYARLHWRQRRQQVRGRIQAYQEWLTTRRSV